LLQQWPVMQDNVESLAFAPDSHWLAAGCIDGWVRTVRVPSGELVAEFREEGRILDLRFATDGRTLAYCSIQGMGFHDFAAGAHFSRRGNFGALRAAIAPDFKLLAALLPHGLVWYWGNPQTNVIFPEVIGNPFNDHAQAISPDGRWLANAGVDHSIEIWSLAEKKPLRRLVGHRAAVRGVAWSADSRLLASGGYDQTVAVWDAERGTLLRRLRGHRDYIATLAFSPDGRTLYSGSYDRTVRAWTDLETASDPDVIALPAQTAELCLGPGAHFAWGVAAANNAFWALKTQPVPKPYGRLQGGHADLAISPDGQWLVATKTVCEVFRYESDEYAPYASHQINVTSGAPPVFSRDGFRIALVGTEGVLAVWQLEPWREVARWKSVEGYPKAIVFDPPGKRLFVAREKFGIFVADTETGRLLLMAKERKSSVSGMDISPDNRFTAMSHYDGTIVLWACAPDEEPRSLGPIITERTDAWSVAFSPDGRRLAVGLADGNIHIWDIQHRLLVGVLKGHRQLVWELGFNPDDDTLVSVSPDELRVWRVANSD
jgi:WD40 repeat protein